MTRKQLPFMAAFPVLMLGAVACACLGSGTGVSGVTATANAAATRGVATARAAATSAVATAKAADSTGGAATAVATDSGGAATAAGDGKAMGPASAKVTVQEFADFQCPYCQQFATTTELQFVKDYVQTGKVRFEYHHFIVIDRGTGGHELERAAEASECASAQGKFWALHDRLFAHQGDEGSGAFSDTRLNGFAQSVELNMTAFNKCFASAQPAAAVQADMAKGQALGVPGTPSVFVNGAAVDNPFDYSTFKKQLDGALAASS